MVSLRVVLVRVGVLDVPCAVDNQKRVALLVDRVEIEGVDTCVVGQAPLGHFNADADLHSISMFALDS